MWWWSRSSEVEPGAYGTRVPPPPSAPTGSRANLKPERDGGAPVAATHTHTGLRGTEKAPPIHLPFSTILVFSAFGVGFTSGMASGARHTGLVYLAENAHRRPETVQGWYFYNKTKYYRMILGGVQRGASTGMRLTGWVAGWCLIDVLVENARRLLAQRLGEPISPYTSIDRRGLGHWFDGAVAGCTTAMVGIVAYRLSASIVPRMVWLGAITGCITGGLRDLRHTLMYHPPSTVAIEEKKV